MTKPYNVDELRARLTVGERVVGLERRLAEHIEKLREALDQIGQLPSAGATVCLCPECKRVRQSGQHWQPVDQYIQDHTGANILHEVCADCREHPEPQARDIDPMQWPVVKTT